MIICDPQSNFYAPVHWVFDLIRRSYGIDLDKGYARNLRVGISDSDDIQLDSNFYQLIFSEHLYAHHFFFKKEPLIVLPNGKVDYISTIFYMVNCFQEYNLSQAQKDKYGRFDFDHSLQKRFDILETDYVKLLITDLIHSIDSSLRLPNRKSRIFISHDIDSIYGSIKYDGLWALRSGDFIGMFKVIFSTLLSRPPWFNIGQVAKLEDEYDIKACYYWIVQNGRDKQGIRNGDYKIGQPGIQESLKIVKALGNEIGIHKSTMDVSISKEISQLPEVEHNRYHFLKIDLPSSFEDLQNAGIKSDSSLGFPYRMGFRNSFGMPFHPYNIETGKTSEVLEIPLHIMDGMFSIKNRESSNLAFDRITNFIESNDTDAVLSILWHNSEMTNFAYKWSFDCYKRLLVYLYETEFESVLPSQLVERYGRK